MSQATQNPKRSFFSFAYKDAFRFPGIMELKHWPIGAVAVGDFFQQRLERLQRFDSIGNARLWCVNVLAARSLLQGEA